MLLSHPADRYKFSYPSSPYDSGIRLVHVSILHYLNLLTIKQNDRAAVIFCSSFGSCAATGKIIVCNCHAAYPICKDSSVLQFVKTISGNRNIAVDTVGWITVIAPAAMANSHRNTGAAHILTTQAIMVEHIVANDNFFTRTHLAPSCHIAGDLNRLMGYIGEGAILKKNLVCLEQNAPGSGSVNSAIAHHRIRTKCHIGDNISG